MNREKTYKDEMTALSVRVGELLLAAGQTVAVAESCTGGMIGAAITDTAGSSAWFSGGIIAYSNEVKTSMLGVPQQTLERFGAVSAETVKAMAVGVAIAMEADCAVAVSGVAGPGGGTKEKPVGLVYVGFFYKGKTSAFKYRFDGGRQEVRWQTVVAGLQHLVELFGESDGGV